jgi:cytochrome c2/mono/diheme cytochrome c family protein
VDQVNLPALITAVFLLLVLGAVLWYAARVAVPLPEAPAGPPTGALAMERKIIATVAMIAAMALLFLGYGFREPARQVQAQEDQLDTSIDRGIDNFTTLCFPCHGEKGQGAIVPDSNPQRLAPALDRADLRPTDSDTRTKEYDFIFKTIQRGRPGTPMPTWGQIDGGPLLDEQVNELTLMILNGDRPVDYEGKIGTPWQQQGVQVILQRGCGGCHTIPNIPGATGNIGPNLGPHDQVPPLNQRNPIATYPNGVVPNTSVDDLSKWIMNPQALKPGTAMPTLGLSQDEATAAAAFLYSIGPDGTPGTAGQ